MKKTTLHASLILNPGEHEIYKAAVESLRYTNRVIGYDRTGAGASVKVSKNLRINTGGGHSTAIRGTVSDTYNGALFLTNQRLVVLAPKYGFDLNLNDISGITAIGNTDYTFTVSNQAYQVRFANKKQVNEFQKAFKIAREAARTPSKETHAPSSPFVLQGDNVRPNNRANTQVPQLSTVHLTLLIALLICSFVIIGFPPIPGFIFGIAIIASCIYLQKRTAQSKLYIAIYILSALSVIGALTGTTNDKQKTDTSTEIESDLHEKTENLSQEDSSELPEQSGLQEIDDSGTEVESNTIDAPTDEQEMAAIWYLDDQDPGDDSESDSAVSSDNEDVPEALSSSEPGAATEEDLPYISLYPRDPKIDVLLNRYVQISGKVIAKEDIKTLKSVVCSLKIGNVNVEIADPNGHYLIDIDSWLVNSDETIDLLTAFCQAIDETITRDEISECYKAVSSSSQYDYFSHKPYLVHDIEFTSILIQDTHGTITGVKVFTKAPIPDQE